MAKFILAEKREMTQKFTEDGMVVPVTKVVAGPCVITQVKDAEKDGYVAVQLGFGAKKKLRKSLRGHLKKLGNFRYLREFRLNKDEAKELKVGDKIEASVFKKGDIVQVSGSSKGKGFQGVVKRHGFHGSPASHGHKDQLRMPGSIGAGGPQHVFQGTKMGGRMGGEMVSVKNLEIIDVDQNNNEIFIKGALPGAKSNLIFISGVGDLIISVPAKEEADLEKPKEAEIKNEEKPKEAQVEEKVELEKVENSVEK